MQLQFDISEVENLAKEYFSSVVSSASFLAGSAGVSMGKLGAYPFFMHSNDYKSLEESLSADFGSFKPIKGQEILSDSGGYSEIFRLNGVLVAENIHSLKPLKWYLKRREPIRFTTVSLDFECVIKNLQIQKSHFTISGNYKVQNYNITLQKVYNAVV